MLEGAAFLIEGHAYTHAELDSVVHRPEALDQLILSGLLSEPDPQGRRTLWYVGVATAWGRTVAVLPKFAAPDGVDPAAEMARVVQALRRYGKSTVQAVEDGTVLRVRETDPRISDIAIADWLIEDYFQRGLYRPMRRESLLNRPGSIWWARTIQRVSPVLSAGGPIYPQLYTRRRSADPDHLITMLHRVAVQDSLDKYAALLGYLPSSLSHETVEMLPALPSPDVARRAIERALGSAFSDRVLRLLKMLGVWLERQLSPEGSALTVYGTTAFELVWEAVCGWLFGNEIDAWLQSLPRPLWRSASGEEQVVTGHRPDIVRLLRQGTRPMLLLLDAKYYSLRMPPALSGYPGVNDVAKQLFYERILRSHPAIRDHDIEVHNCFLFPRGYGPLVEYAGIVQLDGLDAGPVKILYINAPTALDMYIRAENIDARMVPADLRRVLMGNAA